MSSTGGASGRRSVRHHVWALVAANLLVVVVVGMVGIAVSVRSHRSVHYLNETIAPARKANVSAMQELTDIETYVWGYGISGELAQREQYLDGVHRFDDFRSELGRVKSLDGQLALLVDDFLLAADNWFQAYAEPRVEGAGGVETFDKDRFDRGRELFTEVRTTSTAVDHRLRQLSDQAERSAEDLSHRIVLILVAVLVGGAALSFLVGSRVGRKVTEPLGELEDTALELAAGHHDARAPVSGPREVVQVAAAVNRMADENDRARAVEARIVEQLRHLDAVKSDFVSNVSHELRTPLTSILGYLELLEEEVREHAVDSEMEMVGAAKRNVLRLGELIDDLLALTRSEGQRTALAPLDFAALTRDLVTDLRVASTQQGVDIRLAVPAAPVPVLADASQLSRVVTNLVSNAVKFSQGASEVLVSVEVDGDDAVLVVEDHGIGIPAAELEQLGSRFYRASNAVRMGITGTGLGLRIVQSILENHHGTLDLRSEQGVGTTLRVRLPIHVPDRVGSGGTTDPIGADARRTGTSGSLPAL
jgi:two-component system, OmpR family, sensor kinase